MNDLDQLQAILGCFYKVYGGGFHFSYSPRTETYILSYVDGGGLQWECEDASIHQFINKVYDRLEDIIIQAQKRQEMENKRITLKIKKWKEELAKIKRPLEKVEEKVK